MAKRGFISAALFLATFALAAPLAFAGVNRWTTSGPFGVTVSSLAVDPVNPETVYAGTGRAVFKSRDGGLSWTTSAGVPSGFGLVRSSLAIDPLFSSTVYAATHDGVYKSVDGGGSWTAVSPPVSDARAYSVAVDPVTPSTILAGTAGGLFKSTDGGASWSGRLLSSSIYSLVFSPQTPSTIFGADFDSSNYYPNPSTLYKSTDGGATWSNHNTGISISPGALAIDPTNPSTLYAGAPYFLVSFGGVFRSVDAGSTWRRVTSDRFWMYDVVIDPRNPRTLYAAAATGVFRSTDGGASWSEFNTGLPNPPPNLEGHRAIPVTSLAIDWTGTRLHAGTFGDGVFDYQIFSGAALDLSVGTDSKARLLSVDLGNRAIFRSFDNSGSSTSAGSHGPYSGWSPRAVADGPDSLTRVLWSNLDGSAALWLLGPTGNLASYVYSLGPGWTPADVSVGRDNKTHLLWRNTDGRTALTSVDVSGTVTGSETFGPYPGWLARSISNGPDGLTRLFWSSADGRIGLSLVDAAGHIVATHRFAPAAGWAARDIAVASDNKTRILWANADGRMVLWSVDNSGGVSNSETVYGPPVSGQEATRISAGADGLTRVLWQSPEGTGTVWLMSLDNVFQSSFDVGPN